MPPKKTTAKTTKRTMSASHKAAIAEGRIESRAVSGYLKGLAATKRKRGRQRNVETIRQRIAAIDASVAGAEPITALNLRQERKDLEAELAAKETKIDLSGLEADFVNHAASYGARKGISYGVWRDSGVSTSVLKKAGITRGS